MTDLPNNSADLLANKQKLKESYFDRQQRNASLISEGLTPDAEKPPKVTKPCPIETFNSLFKSSNEFS